MRECTFRTDHTFARNGVCLICGALNHNVRRRHRIMTIPEESRVAEFLRQWAIPRDKGDEIYGILSDPECDEMANLYASDLHALLAEVARLRAELADLEHQRDQALYQRDTARIGGYRDVGI